MGRFKRGATMAQLRMADKKSVEVKKTGSREKKSASRMMNNLRNALLTAEKIYQAS
jgi:hypothetical protein